MNPLKKRRVAYFSMEIALSRGMPTYSGGLGVLAGDTLRSAADLEIPMAAVTLLHRKGYFHQEIDADGKQIEKPEEWSVGQFTRELPPRATVHVEGRPVQIRAWEFRIRGIGGYEVPVYLLDTDLPENDPKDRELTHYLYGGDELYRLSQEILLGVGGLKMLRALGLHDIERFHMNEGHAGLVTAAMLGERIEENGGKEIAIEDIEYVRNRSVFTTHTPVASAFDKFPIDMARSVLSERLRRIVERFTYDNALNTTYLALELSHYINGVAKKHGETSRHMFADYQIDAITNGVHAATWTSEHFHALFDRYIPGWREDNASLRYALSIPNDDVWDAHMRSKRDLVARVSRDTGVRLDPEVFTIGFARRAATYKRGDLLFSDLDRLKSIASKSGAFQLVFAGKAHPADGPGKDLIQRIITEGRKLDPEIKMAYVPNYDLELGALMTSGVDLWLNTPKPPMEASGTSGMKAAVNGVPSLSILDGWWVEGCIDGMTGWSFGEKCEDDDRDCDVADLYDRLEQTILPIFYGRRNDWVRTMRLAIAINGSFFNTQRMMQQYVLRAYFR